jgi:mono/diheme cytochrome c family protein
MQKIVWCLTVLFMMAWFSACGKSEEDADGLSEFERNYGIGPVTERLDIGDLDMEMAQEGKRIFDTYCQACHQLDARITGPRLRNVANEREPEFIMNYILNPTENREKHPVGQKLDEEYAIQMISMGLSQEDTRKVLEYLRAAAENEI